MVENNKENREKLADLTVNGMSLDDLMDYARQSLIDRYEEDNEIFKYDLQWNVDEDGNLYE
jgi:hypothetical protein